MTQPVFIILIALAAEASWANVVGDKLLNYQENYRKSAHWYEFTTSSFCKNSVKPITVKSFFSEIKTLGNKSVRVVHVYADLDNKNCKEKVDEVLVEKLIIPIDQKRTTHVYVTYDSDLAVKSGH